MAQKFNPDYQDRGSMKWLGMYLSEHTASMESEKRTLERVVPKEPHMNPLEIATVIEQAVLKQQSVSVQLKIVNQNGQFSENIIGQLSATNESGIYVEEVLINFDDIRHIQLHHPTKWSTLT